MLYDWYRIFNLAAFVATGLVSRKYTYDLEDIGQETFLACSGEGVSVLFRDVFLPVNFEDQNPYTRDEYAIRLTDDGYVEIGIKVPT